MEVLCINGVFRSDVLAFWKEFGVKFPQEEKIYTIRNVIRNTNGEIGFHLQEIINPHVPIKHPIMGIAMMEPNFHHKRFTTLLGTDISQDELREMIKETQKSSNENSNKTVKEESN